MPAFYILVILATVSLWFLLAFVFKPIGKFFHRLWRDAIDAINEVDDKENTKEQE